MLYYIRSCSALQDIMPLQQYNDADKALQNPREVEKLPTPFGIGFCLGQILGPLDIEAWISADEIYSPL